jgi:K+-sensing histidine kinase KdpD
MRQFFWKSNGHPHRRKSLVLSSESPLRFQRTLRRRYGFALLSVLLACVCVLIGKALFSLPPLLFFSLSLMLTVTYSGFRPALFALMLATILSDFFFIHPAYEFSMNGHVFRISLYYFIGMLITYLLLKRSGANHRNFLILPL